MIRAFQWDLARQVERPDVLRRLLPRYARWGYQELYLHLEDAVHYPSLPGVGRSDAYRHEELGRLVLAADRCGIRVVPIVNLLGHTQYLIKHPDLRELNELRDEHGDPLVSGQICPNHPRTLEVADKLLRDLAPFCTAGKVHVGLDESFHLGKCPRCRAEVERLGMAGHFAAHVNRLHGLVTQRGLRMGLWADMLYFVPDAIPLLPAGVIAYDWYYYAFHQAPRVEMFNFAERDLHAPLKRQGILYYGCPMNGAFRCEPLPVFGDRLANIRSWWRRCQAVQAEGLLITSWEAYRLALPTTTTVDAAAASLWTEHEHDDATSMLAKGLERTFGSRLARVQARALLAADSHAFAGYARWQINDRWDVFAGGDSVKPFEAEVRFFDRILASSYDWPDALSASLQFRRYLAERDVFVRRAACQVLRARRILNKGQTDRLADLLGSALKEAAVFTRAIRTGVQAARRMRLLTRRRDTPGQNETLLQADQRRLKEWQAWLKRALRDPSLVAGDTPVVGAWQLCFRVHNFAPAVQKVVVEQQEADGSWREIFARHTIEFRGYAARPRTQLVRAASVPVAGPDARLRLRVLGVGQVRLSGVVLTNGPQSIPVLRPPRSRLLGRQAPTQGLPVLDAVHRSSIWNLR